MDTQWIKGARVCTCIRRHLSMHLLPVTDIELRGESHVHLQMANKCDGQVFRVNGEQRCRLCPCVTNLVPTSFDGVLCIEHALEACGHPPAKISIASAPPASTQRLHPAPLPTIPRPRLLFNADDLVRELSACVHLLSKGAMTSSITIRLSAAVTRALQSMPHLIPVFEAYGWKDAQFQSPPERDALLELMQYIRQYTLFH